jgi:hypothetical protein
VLHAWKSEGLSTADLSHDVVAPEVNTGAQVASPRRMCFGVVESIQGWIRVNVGSAPRGELVFVQAILTTSTQECQSYLLQSLAYVNFRHGN